MVSTEMLEALACPACTGRLCPVADTPPVLSCASCDARYSSELGIPILLPPNTRRRSNEGKGDTTQNGLTHKEQQVAFFDQNPADDFGVTRPRGAPKLYGWLLREKFRRSILGIEELLPGSTALVICGGSGLDAEFLAQTGAHVILSDISHGVLLQARERARRFRLDLKLLVADAESLPFRDASIDLVYVHDGLHHLEQPSAGLAEMLRVARRAISVSEPADAQATSAAVHFGWAEEREESGNPVRRLTVDEILCEVTKRGFRPVRPHRYAMYYRHWPGRAVRLLSRPILFPLSIAAFTGANCVLGRYGNKLTVQAVREACVEPE